MKPPVTDELWAMVGPLLPRRRAQPTGGRPGVDDRAMAGWGRRRAAGWSRRPMGSVARRAVAAAATAVRLAAGPDFPDIPAPVEVAMPRPT